MNREQQDYNQVTQKPETRLDRALASIEQRIPLPVTPDLTQTPTQGSVYYIVNQVNNVYLGDSATPEGESGKMKLHVVLTPGEDGYVIAECPSIPGCATQGKTREEAIENIKEAIEICLDVRKEMGLPLAETLELEV